jgi:hypothetical protein
VKDFLDEFGSAPTFIQGKKYPAKRIDEARERSRRAGDTAYSILGKSANAISHKAVAMFQMGVVFAVWVLSRQMAQQTKMRKK